MAILTFQYKILNIINIQLIDFTLIALRNYVH